LSGATLLSQGFAIIQLQPQLGFTGSVKVGVTDRPDFLHCTRLIEGKNITGEQLIKQEHIYSTDGNRSK
jgi:acetolactate synthase small subunit